MTGLLALALLAGGLEMPPLTPGSSLSPALLAEEGPWLPGLAASEQIYAFVANPFGIPDLWYMGLGIRKHPWSVAARQYGNPLYRHLRLNWGVRSPQIPVLLGIGVETLRLGPESLEGLWWEVGTPVWHRSPVHLETVAWGHLLRKGYRWVGLRVLGRLTTSPIVGFALDLEPNRPPTLAWHVAQRIHRLLALQLAYRSAPRLLVLSVGMYTRPALVYSVAYHPDLGLSHGAGMLWWTHTPKE